MDYQNVTLWLKYIEMEAKNKFVMSCRNLYERACQLLPRVEQFWFKYAHMEELLGNYAGKRCIKMFVCIYISLNIYIYIIYILSIYLTTYGSGVFMHACKWMDGTWGEGRSLKG